MQITRIDHSHAELNHPNTHGDLLDAQVGSRLRLCHQRIVFGASAER